MGGPPRETRRTTASPTWDRLPTSNGMSPGQPDAGDSLRRTGPGRATAWSRYLATVTSMKLVRETVERHVRSGAVPGMVAVVAHRGSVHVEAVGQLAFEGPGSGTPMAAD